MEIRKPKTKCSPITIDRNTQLSTKAFIKRLQEMSDNKEVTDLQSVAIFHILNTLDEYDRNLLIAYYDQADCSPTRLGKLLGIDSSRIASKIKTILNKCKMYSISSSSKS